MYFVIVSLAWMQPDLQTTKPQRQEFLENMKCTVRLQYYTDTYILLWIFLDCIREI